MSPFHLTDPPSPPPPPPTQSLKGRSHSYHSHQPHANHNRNRKAKRIIMNPPQSFIDYAASVNPQTNQVNTPIIIGQGGQAVMIPAGSGVVDDSGNAGSADPNSVVGGAGAGSGLPVAGVESAVTSVAATTTTPTSASSVEQSVSVTTSSLVTTQTQTTAETTPATTSPSSSTNSPDASTASTVTLTSITTVSPTGTSDMNTATISASINTASSFPSANAVFSSITTSPSSSTSSTTVSSPSTTSSPSHPFTHSAAFIFLLILSSLVLVALIATFLSTLLRRSFFPCCRPRHSDLDDEGLSDIVQSFHTSTPSRSSTIRRNGSVGDTDLQRRSSLFANGGRGNSPFLHSGETMGYDEAQMGEVGRLGGAGSGSAGSIAVPTPAHLFGVTGPLEVRNAFPGELGHENEAEMYERVGDQHEVLSTSSPRFLGLDGQGLDVPWSRSRSGDTIGLGITAHDSKLSSPYLSPPDVRDYLGPAFPSPAATVDVLPQTTNTHHTFPDYPSPDQPQRAGTWASNLRSTLFAAIASTGVGGQPKPDPSHDDDKFTRQILPLHRNSIKRAANANFGNTGTFGRNTQAFPIVVEEKDAYEYSDHYHMRASDVEVIGSVFLAPSISMSSADSRYPVMPVRAKKMPLRGSAGERYKAAYARSRGGVSEEESGVESEAGWSVDERVPSRLAGGERAKGVRGSV